MVVPLGIGLSIDPESAWEAWEKGNAEFEKGNGEEAELLIDATAYLDRNPDSGIINTGYGSGELAKPYSSDLIPSEINNYIEQLSDYGSCTEVDKALNFSDISLMSRQTGTEFASVTIGDKHYLIKGDEKGTPISAEMLEEMRKHGGILNCHTHPYIGDLKVSETDLELAKEMYWQDKFYVISPDGQCAVYNKYGIIEVKAVSRQIESEDLDFYKELFEE